MADIRILTPQDQPKLEAFLHAHLAETMILRGNLARGGIVDGDQPYQGRYAAAFDGDRILGVAAHYWQGMLLVFAPDHAGAVARAAVSDRPVAGILGPWQQALDAQEALALDDRYRTLRSKEVLMTLRLDALRQPAPLPNQSLTCRRATEADLDLLTEWRLAFTQETLSATPSQTVSQHCRAEVERWVAEGDQFLLFDGTRPVAGCCFNARLPDAVQVGNVWTPPDLRSRGYGRAVVAGALASARQAGAALAVLFTPVDNEAARTAYAALGFTPVGDYAILLFKQ
ncbi:MAG: GNAT family N-acetyltransferase [Ferrovibrio sp.]|uniref:GNAT family N-acetyltransferase n=1 Tax=Ferrovibrio sp. TaxID=1917215 RepID=UPI0039195FA2